MSRLMRFSLIAVVAVACLPLAAQAQYLSELVGFNGPPIDDPATAREMFQQPGFSGTTVDYILANDPNAPYGNQAAYRASGLQTEGAAAMQVYFNWVDTVDPDCWLRLTTFNGPERPNPSLHTAGKVRFKITNRSEYFQGDIGLCLGIRETGVEVPQLDNGGSSGDIEWVGVSTVPNGIVAGPDGIVNTTATGDDVQVYEVGTDILGLGLPSGTAVIEPGPNGTIDTTPVPDDELRRGYRITEAGTRQPIPAITLGLGLYSVEWDLATGQVRVNGTLRGGGIAGFTGNGVLDVTPTRGTLEHIAFTNVTSDAAVFIDVAIDELQFEAPEPDPVLPPTVVAPILADTTEVVVTDLMFTVEQVTLYANDAPLETRDVSAPDDVTFTIAPAVPGDVYTATQSVGGIESPQSDPVAVTYSDHFPAIYMAPAEGDDTVTVLDLDPGATSVTVVVNSLVEFTATPDPGADRVDVPVSGLVAGDLVTAYYEVDGAPSVETLPETVTVSTTNHIISCDGFETYADQAAMEAFWTQGYADPAVLLSTEMNATCPSGLQSAFAPGSTAYMYHEIEPFVPTATEPLVFNVNIYDPVGVDPDGSVVQWAELNTLGGGGDWFYMHIGMLGWADTDNVHYDFRAVGNGGPNWVDLDEYDAPDRSFGWHNFTVIHKGNYIDVYVDGKLSKKNLTLTAETTYSRADIGGGYAGTEGVWFDDLCVETGLPHLGCVADGDQPPPPAALRSPLEDGDEVVTVTRIDESVTLVEIVDESATVIGTLTNPTEDTVDVPLTRPLVHLERITVDVSNPAGTTGSAAMEVGKGNGDILICVGVRETGDTGPLGSEGSASGTIEWIGASSAVSGAPQGVAISPSDDWQTLVFDPSVDPVTGFTGDGFINGTRGVFEHLAVAVNAASADRSTGAYRLYVDNVINVGADGGSDFVITDFETYELESQVLFQEPGYSGSTAGDLSYPPDYSGVTDAYGNPGQSEFLSWFWVDSGEDRWARITTYSTDFVPSPIIDLTKPIQLDVLLVETVAEPIVGDVDGDGDVDLSDLAALLASYNECVGDPAYNPAADFDESGCVDLSDLAALLANYGFGT